jgi:hypothetical protein
MNFVTEELANSLGIKQRRCSVPIGANLENLTTTAQRHITATITNKGGTYKRTVTFLVIPTISPLVPDQAVDRSGLKVPKNLQLADPEFHKPSPIDILLSAGPTVSPLCIGQIKLDQAHNTELCLQKTCFGWVIGGSPAAQSSAHSFHTTTADL